MGTNRRYAEQIDRRMDDRILERLARSGSLETLTRAELQLDELPTTTDPRPRPVQAWVRFGGTPVRVDAEACMWTGKAVAIRFHAAGQEFRCWVWSGAVEAADPGPPAAAAGR